MQDVNALTFLFPLKYLFRKQHIERYIDRCSRIVYFMDDDLFDPTALSTLPKEYRTKIIRRSAAQHRWITQYCDDIWVSTVFLAKKYSHLNPEIVSAKPSPLLLEKRKPVRIAYHGSSSHREEKYWPVPALKFLGSMISINIIATCQEFLCCIR